MRGSLKPVASPIQAEQLERAFVAANQTTCTRWQHWHGATLPGSAPSPACTRGASTSSAEQQAIICELLAKEVSAGRMIGPCTDPPYFNPWAKSVSLGSQVDCIPLFRLIPEMTASTLNEWMQGKQWRSIGDVGPKNMVLATVDVKAA